MNHFGFATLELACFRGSTLSSMQSAMLHSHVCTLALNGQTKH